MSYNDSDIFPTNIFFDPLLLPQWHRISGHNVIEVLIDGNDYLKSYIKTLDREIAMDQSIEHKNLVKKLLDTLRGFGWCVVSFYNEDSEVPYRVFNPNLKEDWIKETETIEDKEGTIERIKRIGCKFVWHDDLGNIYRERCFFEDQIDEKTGEITNAKSYFLIWERGNGRQKRYLHPDTVFALSDLDLGTLTSAIAAHQVKATLEITAVKPFFLHFIYGQECTTTQSDKVRNQMGYVGPNAGFAAKRSVVDEIKKIENADIPNSILALDKLAQGFANMTRLPLAFFLGERQKGGLSETGDDSDEGDITNRKEEILSRFEEICGEILSLELGIVIDKDIYEKQRKEVEAKNEEKLLEKSIEVEETTEKK